MLDAWGDHPALQATLQEASDALGQDVGALIAHGTKEELALTTNTQPVMLVAGVAAYRIWLAEGGEVPAVVAGHSLGEYSALVAAGVLTLTQAAPLVRLRAAAMQEAVPVGAGAMAAILGLPAAQVIEGCAQARASWGEAPEVAEAVNFNDPAQTVIAGTRVGVDKACEILKAMGAKRALQLPVSAPFHSSLMKPAAQKLRHALQGLTLASPSIRVLNNVDVAIEADSARIADALYRQAFGPVRWVECVLAIQALGVNTLIECGPGKALTGMAKRIDTALSAAALNDPLTLQDIKGMLA